MTSKNPFITTDFTVPQFFSEITIMFCVSVVLETEPGRPSNPQKRLLNNNPQTFLSGIYCTFGLIQNKKIKYQQLRINQMTAIFKTQSPSQTLTKYTFRDSAGFNKSSRHVRGIATFRQQREKLESFSHLLMVCQHVISTEQ